MPGGWVPADARITKVGEVKIEHRIASIARPGAAVVEAEGNVLRLKSALRGLAMARVDRNEAVGFRGAKTGGVFMIDDDASGEDHDSIFFWNGNRQLLPMEQIGADCVAPAHVSPLVSKGVVLEEEVILALEVDEAVWVVRPVFSGREVHLRAVGLVVLWSLRTRGQSAESECGDADHFANTRFGQGSSSLGQDCDGNGTGKPRVYADRLPWTLDSRS